ncbi:hypothetical protein Q5752_003656 [Cryptotrichosporon argae]
MAFASHVLRAAVPAAALGSALYASAATAAADEGVRPGRAKNGDKLPIYPAPEPTLTLVETPHPLAPHIATAREATTGVLGQARDVVEQGVSRWIGFERKVEHEIKTVLPADEPLTPGLIYVLVSGLTGSVLTRTRSFPLRFLAPPLFTLAAFPYFLPKTSARVRAYLSELEDAHFPDFAARHDRVVGGLEAHWAMALDRVRGAGAAAKGWSEDAVRGVESSTGLKVGDAVRRGREAVDAERARFGTLAPRPQDVKVERVGYVVEQKPVAEIVRVVEPPKPVERAEVAENKAAGGKRLV